MESLHIFNNLEVVIYIYKLLNINDQFRLAKVSAGLRNVFVKYIFPKNYRTLNVIGNLDYFIFTNEAYQNRMTLQFEELQEFLHYNENRMQAFGAVNSITFDIGRFQNLTTLSYGFMKISREHFIFLGKLENNYPKLEKLHIDCCWDEEGNDIMVGQNWSVKTLLGMKNLKSLKVNMPHIPANWVLLSYQDFRELITKLKLQNLNLKCIVQPPKRVWKRPRYNSPNPIHLKELDIGFNFGSQGNLLPYLDIFENLVKLVATVRKEEITEILLRNIAEVCINLKVLHIQSSYFKNIQAFCIPANVVELSLYLCHGLTNANLQQILMEPKLAKFSSQSTYYECGSDLNTRISPTIQELDFKADYWHNFKFAFGGSKHLKRLSWNSLSHISSISDDVIALRKSINLEELNLQTGSLTLNTLSQLQSLRKLVIPPSLPPSRWSYVIAILQHPSLNEFVMNKYCPAQNLQNARDIPLIGFPTNIRILKITLEIFAMALDFWLDLFNQNIDLQLEVYDFREDQREFMRSLITHENFPRYLRTVDICSFKINCSDLRWHLDVTMDKLRKDIAHFKYENDEMMYCIIFSRNTS